MALQALLLRRKIEEKQGRMAGLLEKRETQDPGAGAGGGHG